MKNILLILVIVLFVGCKSRKSSTETIVTIKTDTVYTPKLIPIVVPPDTLKTTIELPCPEKINKSGSVTSKNGKQTINYSIKDNKLEIESIQNQYVLWQTIYEKTINKEINKIIREKIELEQKHKGFVEKLGNLMLWFFGIILAFVLLWLYGKWK